jgi:hypothetical protein
MPLDENILSVMANFDPNVRDRLRAEFASTANRIGSLEQPAGLGGGGVYNAQVEGLVGDGITDNRVVLPDVVLQAAVAWQW